MFAIIVHFNIQKLNNKHTFIQTEKAKSSHFDRTRGDKKQIFPTINETHPRLSCYGSLWCGLGLFTQIGRCVPAHTPPTILGNVGHNILKTKMLRNQS